jgi:hypothetical protein
LSIIAATCEKEIEYWCWYQAIFGVARCGEMLEEALLTEPKHVGLLAALNRPIVEAFWFWE